MRTRRATGNAMTRNEPKIRRATTDDAPSLAELINLAGEGLPLHLWEGMASPGQSAWDVGVERARRDLGGFSYRNAFVLEYAGRVAAGVVGYPLTKWPSAAPGPAPPGLLSPIEALERLAGGTWYINAIATYPEARGRGYANRLLDTAEDLATDAGGTGVSLIVSDANIAARRLYERRGYRFVDERPMIKENWENPGARWLLYTKRIA
jgi:ribosomal protein S18 acetylase RimI-like enzyme